MIKAFSLYGPKDNFPELPKEYYAKVERWFSTMCYHYVDLGYDYALISFELDKPVACLLFGWSKDYFDGDNRVLDFSRATACRHRRKGHASALLRHFLELYPYEDIWVTNVNKTLTKSLRRSGFEAVGVETMVRRARVR